MLQQRLARSLQSFARPSSPLCLPRSSRRGFAVHIAAIAPIASQRFATQRWYSSTQEAEKKQEDASKDQPEAQETPKKEAAEEEPVQKELESKKKENVELTVRQTQSDQ